MTQNDQSLIFEGGEIGFLLIHGLGGTPVELRVLAKGLQKAGYTVHCPQLPGHCGSEDDLKHVSWRDWVAGSEAALDHLRKRCGTVVVGGLSMGAVVALQVARNKPADVAGLSLLGATLWYDGWAIPWYGFLLRLLIDTPVGQRFRFVEREPYGIKDERTRRMIKAAMERGNSAEAGLLGTPSQAVREMWRLVKSAKAAVPEISQPALVMHAREDDVAGLSNALYLQRHLAGPVKLVVLEDSYHMITIDRESALVIAEVAAFARSLAPAADAPPPVARLTA